MSFLTNLVNAGRFLRDNFDQFVTLLVEHLTLVLISEVLAILVAVPLGILATRNERAKAYILGAGNVAQTIPTLAVIALVFPLLGIGFLPALVGLFTYAVLPILTNTITGLEDISEDTVQAARGMGMTDGEILRKIKLPLSLPVIFAGIRTSVVLNVGTAYLAFFIGGGGLGVWVIGGINLFQMEKVLAGAIPGALLAITMDSLFALIERKIGGEAGVNQQAATG
jgi:osmoprotectant transport system permease protein